MNGFTAKWFATFLTSLMKLTPDLKQAMEMKKNGKWEDYKPFVDERLYKWLNPLMDMAKVDFHVEGKEKIPQNEPVIYTPNHSGMFDIPAVVLNTPKPPIFMAKKELASFPMLKQWMWVIDCVFVDRKNKNSARSSLQDAIDMVKNGRSLVVFPEGTRSKDGTLGKFKGGAMKVAMESGAKVVPVLIEGSRERLEATGSITGGTVHITFLDPIETKGLTKEDFLKMPDEIRDMIQKKRDENEAARGKIQ